MSKADVVHVLRAHLKLQANRRGVCAIRVRVTLHRRIGVDVVAAHH